MDSALMQQPDDALRALGLPKPVLHGCLLPRHDTTYASWSLFAVDSKAGDYYTFAALAMILYQLQRDGLIKALVVTRPHVPHLLLEAQWCYTAAGDRAIAAVLDDLPSDDDPFEMI